MHTWFGDDRRRSSAAAALARTFAAVLLGTTCACAAAPGPLAAPPTAGASAVDVAGARAAIERELDDFHAAAARADEARYFGHLADDAVFLGTDATERWDVAAFRAFAHPHFASGKAWTFHAVRRAVSVADDGRLAYFDEDLATEKLGPARGSGVLALRGGRWLIVQYNLALVIPNERFAAVHALLEAPPAPPFEDRYHAAYARATQAASAGDFEGAERELAALVDEASRRPDDDTEFWLHNELTWVRWAEGDLQGALAQVDGARAALGRVHLSEEKIARLGLHEKWDRAYLLLELAQAAPPTLRAAAKATAIAARAEYDRAAAPLGDHDGMAVLAAFFALRTGDTRAAQAAAKSVDAGHDDDLQDLYVLALALDAGGDRAGASALRDRIRAGHEYLMKPIIVRRLQADASPSR